MSWERIQSHSPLTCGLSPVLGTEGRRGAKGSQGPALPLPPRSSQSGEMRYPSEHRQTWPNITKQAAFQAGLEDPSQKTAKEALRVEQRARTGLGPVH